MTGFCVGAGAGEKTASVAIGFGVVFKSSGEGIMSIFEPELALGMVGFIASPEPEEIGAGEGIVPIGLVVGLFCMVIGEVTFCGVLVAIGLVEVTEIDPEFSSGVGLTGMTTVGAGFTVGAGVTVV